MKEVEERDEEGEHIYIGARGESVIDYALINAETRRKIDRIIIEDRIESDHLSICVYLQLRDELNAKEVSSQYNIQRQQIWIESIKKH